MVYLIKNDIMHIKEMIYLNREAKKGLWEYIHAHDSMIDEVHGNTYFSEPPGGVRRYAHRKTILCEQYTEFLWNMIIHKKDRGIISLCLYTTSCLLFFLNPYFFHRSHHNSS